MHVDGHPEVLNRLLYFTERDDMLVVGNNNLERVREPGMGQ